MDGLIWILTAEESFTTTYLWKNKRPQNITNTKQLKELCFIILYVFTTAFAALYALMLCILSI